MLFQVILAALSWLQNERQQRSASSILCVFVEMCCFSIFNKINCYTNFLTLWLTENLCNVIRKFLSWLTWSHIVGIYWEYDSECVMLKCIWVKYLFFTWNLSKLISRKVIPNVITTLLLLISLERNSHRPWECCYMLKSMSC